MAAPSDGQRDHDREEHAAMLHTTGQFEV